MTDLLERRETARQARIANMRASVLKVLRLAASAGLPCPSKEDLRRALGQIPFEATPTQLATQGLCVVELYGRHFRVVEIDGMRTAAAPNGGKPYRIIRKEPA